MKVFVIIPAAGLGTRMAAGGARVSKQFTELAGTPILMHTLLRFAECNLVNEIVVALRANEISQFTPQLKNESIKGKVRLVEGGENRQQSVANALASVKAEANDIVLVHDGVRPFVDSEIITRVIESASKYGAAIAGMPAIDTVKQVERTAEGAIITSTIPRERVVMAQTPQGFRYSIIQRAFADAAAVGFTGTDEASLAERMGQEVAVVMGSPRNIKITTPNDMELAEFIASRV